MSNNRIQFGLFIVALVLSFFQICFFGSRLTDTANEYFITYIFLVIQAVITILACIFGIVSCKTGNTTCKALSWIISIVSLCIVSFSYVLESQVFLFIPLVAAPPIVSLVCGLTIKNDNSDQV